MNERKLTDEQREKAVDKIYQWFGLDAKPNGHEERRESIGLLVDELLPILSPATTFPPGEIQDGVDVYKKGGVQSGEEMVTAESILKKHAWDERGAGGPTCLVTYKDALQAMHDYAQSLTAGVRKEKTDNELLDVALKYNSDAVKGGAFFQGLKYYRDNYSQSVPKEQGEGWVEIKRSWDDDNLPEGEVLAMNMDENRVYWIMMGKISEYTLFKSKQVELKCTDNDGNWRSGPTHYRTIESLSLPTPPKPE